MRAQRASVVIGVFALVVSAVLTAGPVQAATTTQWATWQPLTGTGGAYRTSVQVTPDPTMTAIVTSDSRAGQVGVISGASTWLSEGTPVGEKYGSSRNQSYLNLRPRADSPTGASTTTYSFQSPTPTAGWTFVLGDIDADAVRIEATGPDGQALTADELGFRGGFNYCAPGVAGKPSCTGDAADVPTWDASTRTLTGNAAAADTAGAAAWFEPNAPITSLTFFFTRRAGLPVYQTWFASLARDISGTVADDASAPVEGAQLVLTDASGRVVASTISGVGGTYSFPGVLATNGYTVRAQAPDGQIVQGPSTRPVDLAETDAVGVDFVVRDIIPVAVTGRVVDDNGNGVGGVTVTIDGGLTALTDTDGRYLFDTVPAGDRTLTVSVPNGYSTADGDRTFTVPADSEVPIAIPDDIVLVENADLSGTVVSSADGVGLAGTLITVTDSSDAVVTTTVSRPLGGYTVPRLPAGDYTVSITPPTGYTGFGPVSVPARVGTTDVVGVDFALAPLGSFSGTVRDTSGAPVAGVTLTLEGPGGTQQLVSDEDGAYGLGGLPSGDYLLTITPPAGTEAVEFARRSFGFPPQGGGPFTNQDFTLAAVAVEPTDPATPGNPPAPSSPGAGNGSASAPDSAGSLPATGLSYDNEAWVIGGTAALLAGAALLVWTRRRTARHV